MILEEKINLKMLESFLVRWCGDTSDQIFAPGMNHTYGGLITPAHV